jgi:alkylation response protein AidB-like acyl-CoA dehydrogenase
MMTTDLQDTAASTGEQSVARMLRDSAASFVQGRRDTAALRRCRHTLPGHDPEIYSEMVALGWLGLLAGEEQGGSGLGFAEMAGLAEELGKGLLAEPLIAVAVLAQRALQHGDQPGAVAPLLRALAAGERRVVLAWQEQAGLIGPHAIDTWAARCSEGWRITGAKHFIAGAGGADGFLVTARIDDGLGLFHVDANAQGLAITHQWRADGTPSASIGLHDVRLGEGALLASPRCGLQAVSRALDEAAVMAAAELLGVARAAFEMTLEYLRTRVQFERPIGSFQALQHKAVDLLVQQELAASVVEEAAHALDTCCTDIERARIASRAKARCSDAALRITREAIQLHGAIAYTDEYDAGLYLKRAIVLAAWLGNGSQHRARHAALMDQA